MSIHEIEKRPAEQPGNGYIDFPDLPNLSESKLLPQEMEKLEALHGITSTGEFFVKAAEIAVEISKRHIPAGVDKEKAAKVLDSTYFSGVSSTDKEYDGLLTVALMKHDIQRQIIRPLIKERKDSLDLTETERVVLLHSLDIQDQNDRFYWQFRQNVVTSPLGLKLKEIKEQNPNDPNKSKEYLLQHGVELPESKYIYVTFNQGKDGKIRSVPYANAFPESINAISSIVNDMVSDLEKVMSKDESEDKERHGLINYYKTFNRALTCEDPKQLEERFKKLDTVWFEVQGRMQPVHMMEQYADPVGLRVDPDYLLLFRDDRYPELNNKVDRTKEKLIGFLERDYGYLEAFPPSKKPMEASVAGIYSALESGSLVEFAFQGQNVPNRQEVRSESGVKIFLNYENMRRKDAEYKELLTHLFGEEYAQSRFIDMEDMTNIFAGVQVPGHEVAHNFLIRPNTRDLVGDFPIEEHKADMAGTLVAAEILDMPDQQISLQALLAWSLRHMKNRDIDSNKPYYNTALCYLKTMHNVGILNEGNEKTGWTYDDSPGKVKAFFSETRAILNDMSQVYETLNPQKAQEFTRKYYKEEPFISAIHEKLGLKPRIFRSGSVN